MAREEGTVEQNVVGLSSRSHGVLARAELLRAGVTVHEIRVRLERGTLLPLHRGVRIIRGSPPPPEVLTPDNRTVRGVIIHRARRTAIERALRLGVPVTTVPRTLVDLASSLPEPALARACHEAGVLYRTTPRQVDKVLRDLPSAAGRKKLERVLHGEVPVTLSRLESRFLQLLRDARLPLPVTNRIAGTHRVDCRWPEQRLTVELDSYRFHNSRHSWEKDRRRESEARRRGDEFRRYVPADVFGEAGPMLAEVAELLGRPGLRAI